MKRILCTILLAAFLLLPSSISSLAFQLPPAIPLVTQVRKSIVRLDLATTEEVPHPVCTAFVVAQGQALTAAHCLPSDDTEMFADGELSKVLKRNKQFGLVTLADTKKPPLTIRSTEALIGEDVRSFGYAWGYLNVFRRTISSRDDVDAMLDSPLAPGMSGGPVVDVKGEVVGINQLTNEVVGIVCGPSEIRRFLK